MAATYIGIGSSIEPENNIPAALRMLKEQIPINAVSMFYRTSAIGRPSDPCFYNGIVSSETQLPLPELKSGVLHKIENALGRIRTVDRFAPRTIDLDILYREEDPEGNTDPDIIKRPFLTAALAELAPDLVLPGQGKTVSELADPAGLEKLEHFTNSLQKEMLP